MFIMKVDLQICGPAIANMCSKSIYMNSQNNYALGKVIMNTLKRRLPVRFMCINN